MRLRPEWGGGCLWDVGCYPLSFARFVLGAEPVEVFGSAVLGETGVDETFAGQLVFPGGVLVQIDARIPQPGACRVRDRGHDGRAPRAHPWKPREDQPMLLTAGWRHGDDPGGDRRTATGSRSRTWPRRSPRAGAPLGQLAESRGNVRTISALLESAREGRPIRP